VKKKIGGPRPEYRIIKMPEITISLSSNLVSMGSILIKMLLFAILVGKTPATSI
jgi:hypothetical protein